VKNNPIKFFVLLLLFLVAGYLSLYFGGTQEFNDYIFYEIRLPKTITAILAGSTLAVSGLILQVIFRNPLAGPYVLGISSGASLAVAITILAGTTIGMFGNYFIGKTLLVISSVAGSLGITFLILILAKKISSNVILLLTGLMLSQICSAIQGALEYFSNPNDLKSFVMWTMGSLSSTTSNDLYLFIPIALVPLLLLIFFIKPLNAFLLGQNYAEAAGVNYKSARFYLILISSILTGLTTAFCGPIAFVGIAVPILTRMIFKTSAQGTIIIASIFIGSILLLLADFLSHHAAGVTLPINMITTFVGAPLVLVLLFKNKQW
jgi:iron complex transport system permease protein